MRVREIVVKRIATIKFWVDSGSGNGRGCFGIEVRTNKTNTTELTNMIPAGRIWADRRFDLKR